MGFTTDWFSHNIPVWDSVIPKTPGQNIIEIGSFEGKFFIIVLGKSKGVLRIEVGSLNSGLIGLMLQRTNYCVWSFYFFYFFPGVTDP